MPRSRSTTRSRRPDPPRPAATPERPGGYYRLLFDVFLLFHVTRRVLGDVLAETGLSAEDFGLYSLVLQEGAVTPGDLVRWTGLRPTTMSSMLRRIEARGHMVRIRNPNDARSYHLDLTPSGRDAALRALETFWPFMNDVDARLGGAEWSYRLALQDVDTVLREAGRLERRPYRLSSIPPPSREPQALIARHPGPRL